MCMYRRYERLHAPLTICKHIYTVCIQYIYVCIQYIYIHIPLQYNKHTHIGTIRAFTGLLLYTNIYLLYTCTYNVYCMYIQCILHKYTHIPLQYTQTNTHRDNKCLHWALSSGAPRPSDQPHSKPFSISIFPVRRASPPPSQP